MASPDGRPIAFNVEIPWHLEAFNDDHEQMEIDAPVVKTTFLTGGCETCERCPDCPDDCECK